MTKHKLAIANSLDLDPAALQHFAGQHTPNTPRTPAELHALRHKRNKPQAPAALRGRSTRDQRAHDALHKRLASDADMLTHLRRLAIGNYFVVPAKQAIAVRNMTNRERVERGIRYTTTKFVYGRSEFLKVQRHNPIND